MKLGIIGYGNMGSAFARALRESAQITVYDISEDKRERAKKDRFAVAKDPYFLIKECDYLLLAVKPKDIGNLLSHIRDQIEDRVLISIAAGVEIAYLKEVAGGHQKVVRMMPNINVEVSRGAIALCYAEGVSEEERKEIKETFSVCGNLYEIPESLFDSFTALAGSGPAFVFAFIDALAMAGVREGFSYETALAIVLDTIEGSALMVRDRGESPDNLIKKVTSPGGTTIEGLAYLERKGFRGTVIKCVEKTSEKAKRLRS